MTNDNKIILTVELDTSGFEKSMQNLNTVTQNGIKSFVETMKTVTEIGKIGEPIATVSKAISEFNGWISMGASSIEAFKFTMEGLNATAKASTIGLVIAGIGLAIGAATFAISTFSNITYESTIRLKELKEAMQNFQESQNKYDEITQAIEIQSGGINNLYNDIINLTNQEKISKQEKSLLLEKIEMLNSTLPSLSLAWDEMTNSLNINEDAVLSNIAAYEARLEMEAAEERLNKLYQEQFTIQEKMDEATEKRAMLQQDMINLQEIYNNDSVLYNMELGHMVTRLDELDEEIETHNNNLAINSKQQQEVNDKIAECSQIIDEHTEAIKKYAENQERILKAVGNIWQSTLTEIEEKIQEVTRIEEEQAQAEENLARDKETFLQKMQKAYDDYVNYANNAFEKLGDPLNISLEEMINNLEYNQEAMKKWSDGIALLANETEHQIDAGFLEKLRNMGPASAGIVEQLVTDMQTGGGKIEEINALLIQGVDDANYQINKGYDFSGFIGDVEQTWKDLAKSIEENTDLIESLEIQKAEAQQVVLSMLQEDDFIETLGKFAGKVGVQIPAGIAEGIANGEYQAVNQVVALINEVIKAAQDSAQIHSPSKIFEKMIGKNIALGVAVGIDDNSDEAIEIGAEAAQNIVDSMGEAIEESFPDLQNDIDNKITLMLETFEQMGYENSVPIGTNIVAGIQAGFEAMLPSLVAQMQAGMASLYAATTGYLGIASPSKLFKDKIGRNIALGISAGISEEMPSLLDETERYIKLLASIPDPTTMKIELNPLEKRSRQSTETMLASSDRSNDMLSRIADYGMQQSTSTPNINVTLEPTADIRGFFDYISIGVKRSDYLNGK